jgi:hypothetical protein
MNLLSTDWPNKTAPEDQVQCKKSQNKTCPNGLIAGTFLLSYSVQ